MTEDLVLRVTMAIAEAEQVAPQSLEYRLNDYIDLDAIAALDAQENSTWELSFDIPDHTVSVTSDGFVFVDGVRFDTSVPDVPM